ncbi:uracil-DNA glycosylase family protein [uncultured Limosilactobacillus sp.]|uniref:uracil-DNA glycosylase family protein n=1 Tax=uncultured Limosilactobacillus sp. TaxID=2837629 RepID=UPI0026002398|nr:uracil-DNA glycosylase family protein [uncultured Limosilactobacillus sp.]
MTIDPFQKIFQEIQASPENAQLTAREVAPLYYAGPDVRINIIAQAPGQRAQEQRMFWNDRSGVRLRQWLGVSWDEFYHSGKIGIMPMDFYFPGNGPHGDRPPRPDFAQHWHPQLLKLMPNIQLTILVGAYAAHAYLHLPKSTKLTSIVHHYQEYLPTYFPIVHPSPRNQIWLAKNPWFGETVLPDLKQRVRHILNQGSDSL